MAQTLCRMCTVVGGSESCIDCSLINWIDAYLRLRVIQGDGLSLEARVIRTINVTGAPLLLPAPGEVSSRQDERTPYPFIVLSTTLLSRARFHQLDLLCCSDAVSA